MRTLLLTAFLLAAPVARAQSHCEHARGGHDWPAIGAPEGGAPATAIAVSEARELVRRFRRAWAGLPYRGAGLAAETECMNGSFEHFTVRRVATPDAERRLGWLRDHGFGASVLAGGALSGPWVYEVYWGGASRQHPPNGAVSAYFAADGQTLLAAAHWPEG